MVVEIFKSLLLNISLMVLVAYLLTKVRLVKSFIAEERPSLRIKLCMAVIFGLIGILATYTGIEVNGAIANTRVIGVIAGGILGGPVVGLGAGFIAGMHRWSIDIGGFTAVACAVSTIVEGAIGGMFSAPLKKSENEWISVCGVTMLAELIQMAVILLFARPFWRAWELVQVISVPMILFNSLGVGVFIGVFDSVFIAQDQEAGNRIRLVMDIADRCLPYLRKGLYSKENLNMAANIILERSGYSGIVITDRKRILSVAGPRLERLDCETRLPRLVETVTETGKTLVSEQAERGDPFYECLKNHSAVCAPLTQQSGGVIGTVVLFIRKFQLSREAECEFLSGLANLFSTQLELSQVDYQKKLRQKAEFEALQSQINPHFLFNALGTITSFCREKPERARELLIVLSNYFRNTLQTGRYMISLGTELEHVNAYLELEKARFEEKLQIEKDIPAGLDCTMPSFILQPIVENAVKHGAMRGAGVGIVRIGARQAEHGVEISVWDNGEGIPDEVVSRLFHDTMGGGSVGLANVHKRLKSIYGEDFGLRIKTSCEGTEIRMYIPYGADITGGEGL